MFFRVFGAGKWSLIAYFPFPFPFSVLLGLYISWLWDFWETETENKGVALLVWVADFGGEKDGAVFGFADEEEEGSVDDEFLCG